MPRSPRDQSPGGRLKSTVSTPASRAARATSSGRCSYGETNSTARKPARAAASKRSRNGTSVKSIVRFAAKRGMDPPIRPSGAGEEHGAGAGAVRSDHERLLDVGGLGRPRDEGAEPGAGERDAPVGLV